MKKRQSQKKLSRKKIFYVYGHYKKDNGQIFYVGKGVNGRLNSTNGRNELWRRTAKKYGWYSEIIKDGLTEKQALAEEKKLIKKYGRVDLETGPLVNMTSGGEDGGNGYFDNNIYRLVNADDEEIEGTRKELTEKYGLCPKGVTSVLSGKRVSVGYYFFEERKKEFLKSHGYKIYLNNKVQDWIRKDGKKERATGQALAKKYGLGLRKLKAVLQGAAITSQDWTLEKNWKKAKPLFNGQNIVDKTEYHFYHEIYGDFIGTKHALVEHDKRQKLNLGVISAIVNRTKKTHYGWCLKERYEEIKNFRHVRIDDTKINWVRIKDGKKERLSSWDLAKKYGLDPRALRTIFQGGANSSQGWCPEENLSKAGYAGHFGINNAVADKNIYTLKNALTGKTETGNKYELAERLGLKLSDLGAVINKVQLSTRGWYLIEREKKFKKSQAYKFYMKKKKAA